MSITKVDIRMTRYYTQLKGDKSFYAIIKVSHFSYHNSEEAERKAEEASLMSSGSVVAELLFVECILQTISILPDTCTPLVTLTYFVIRYITLKLDNIGCDQRLGFSYNRLA